jgi:TRAP transporter TAXI family solute receptor
MLGLRVGTAPAVAQEVPQAIQEGGSEYQLKQRRNTWTVGMVGGLLSGTYMRFADEIAKVLDDGDNMRVLPIVSHGAASNLDDLLYLRGVDVAVTQADVFEYFKNVRKTSNLDHRVNFILRLPIAELHVLARKDIRSLEDLRGKKVSFGPEGSGSSLTGTIVFQRLGIEVEQLFLNSPASLQKLKSGEIAAMLRVIGKPIGFFSGIKAEDGLHLVPIPFSKKFADIYTLGEFTGKEYPTLVPPGGRVDAIAVPTVLAVYNWQKGGDRYRRVERFVERLFENFEKFQKPPFHPKWRDVNLAATVPGWKRFSVAETMLEKVAKTKVASPEKLSTEFQAFLQRPGTRQAAPTDAAGREALFREFLRWREREAATSASR